jgi:hypothetical protein
MKYNNIHLDGFSEWLQNSIDQSTKRINSLNFKGILDHDVYDLNEIASFATKQNNNIQTAFSRMLETKKADYPDLANQFDEIYNQYMGKWNNFYNDTIPMDAINQQIRGLENAKKYNYGHRRDDLLRKMNDRTRRHINAEVSDLNNIVDRKLYEAGYASQYGYDLVNKAYTSKYHSNIDGYIHYGGLGNQNFRNHFFNDEAMAKYEQIKKQYPDLTLNNRTANYEFDIDKAYEQALDMNERYNYERERKDKTIQRHKDRRQNRKENREWAKKTFYDGKKEYAIKEVQRRTEMLENAQNEISKLQEQLRAIDPNSLDPSSIYKRSFIEGEIKTRQDRLSFHQEKLANAKADLEKIAPTPKRKRRAARRDPNNENILESMVTQLETRKHYDQTPWRKKEEAQRRVEQAEQRQAQQQRVKDIRNEQTKINNTNKPYTIDDLNIGDNFLDSKGNRYVYRHMSPKDPSMDIHRDMYHFINTATGEEEVFRNKDGILNFLSKTDNVISVEDAKDLNKARREFDKQSRLYNEMAFDESQMTIEEFEALHQKYFEDKVIPAKEEFDKQNKYFEKKTGQAIELSDREIRAIERFEHDKNYYQERAKETIKDELDPYEWDTKYLDVAEFPNGPQDVIDMAHEEALKMNKSFGNTVEETLENTTENVIEETIEAAGETIAQEVIEEGAEKILKEATGINVELDGLNKKKTSSNDRGSGKKRRKGNSSQADLPKINKLDVDLPEVARDGGSISKYLKEFGNMGFFDKVQTIGAAAGAVSEYKNARRQGHGVVSSTIRAGVDFALGEAMGMYYPLFLLAKEAPGMIVKGSEMLYKENRKMNSSANQQIFGSAQFQDTQQLATMRQSGMEMAKMAQYNLQQTLMGNEATYFHR